jgi:uncharacterized protein (TIGR00106 family)
MIIAEFSVIPMGVGTSASQYVNVAIEVLKETKVKYEIGAMGTTLEAKDLETLLSIIKETHEAVFRSGAKRVVTTIKIDDRRDKAETIESKKKAIKIEK